MSHIDAQRHAYRATSKQASCHVVLHSIYSRRYWEYLDMDIDIALYMYLPPRLAKERCGREAENARGKFGMCLVMFVWR